MSEKNKRRPRREFDASFKVDAVKLVQTGERPVRLIAKELDVTETSLRGWVRQADLDVIARRLNERPRKTFVGSGKSATPIPDILRLGVEG